MNQVRLWLRTPTGWLVFMVTEYLVAIAILRAVLPDRMPVAAGLIVIATVVGLLFVLNLRIRRWIARTEEDR